MGDQEDSHYDVIILGSGPGGYVSAIRCSQLGLKTLCVERCGENNKPIFGGTCLNVGCIPSKALLDSSYNFHLANSGLESHGINLKSITMDVGRMLERKEKIVSGLTKGVESLFRLNKVESVLGEALVLEKGKVVVQEPSGNKVTLTSENIIIATGSSPILLPSIEYDGDKIVTSTGALDFDEVPEKLAIIGAGAIGLELGSVWSRLGSEVVILEALENFLPNADQQISSEAIKILSNQGLDIKLGAKVNKAKMESEEVLINYSDDSGANEIKVDKLVMAVGRKPQTQNIFASELEIKVNDQGFIEVNEFCETSLKGIYAIGDVVRGPMLAHKASEEGIMVAENLAGESTEIDYGRIPFVIYTHHGQV